MVNCRTTSNMLPSQSSTNWEQEELNEGQLVYYIIDYEGSNIYLDPDEHSTIAYSDTDHEQLQEIISDNTCSECYTAPTPELARLLKEMWLQTDGSIAVLTAKGVFIKCTSYHDVFQLTCLIDHNLITVMDILDVIQNQCGFCFYHIV